jgi:hypothetical protein
MKLRLHVTPNARTNEFLGWEDDPAGGRALRVRVAAPPADGKANAALREFLAKSLGISKSQVALDRGESSRHKTVTVPDALAAAVAALAAGAKKSG